MKLLTHILTYVVNAIEDVKSDMQHPLKAKNNEIHLLVIRIE